MGVVLLVGPVAFEALSVTELLVKDGWTYASQDVFRTKPKLQWTKNLSRSITLKVRFNTAWSEPELRMEAIRLLAQSNRWWPVVRGCGFWIGRFVIGAVDETVTQTSSFGHPQQIDAVITMTEWGEGDEAQYRPALIASAASAVLRRTL